MSRQGAAIAGMRISDLAARTRVPVATLKFYLREGLIPAGERTAPNQARYGERHLQRVRLLRLLRDIGDVPVDRLRILVGALDGGRTSPFDGMAAAADAIAPAPPTAGPFGAEARHMADRMITTAGWDHVRPDAPDRENLRAVLEVIVASGTHQDRMSILDAYAAVADQIARFEVADLDVEADPDVLISQMVVGQVVFGNLLATLRRLAEEHHAARRLAGDDRDARDAGGQPRARADQDG